MTRDDAFGFGFGFGFRFPLFPNAAPPGNGGAPPRPPRAGDATPLASPSPPSPLARARPAPR